MKNLQVVFDCTDPDAIPRFWGRALEYSNQLISMTPDEVTEWRKRHPQFDDRGRLDDEDGRRMSVYIQKVPEPKTVRNRLRPEISVPDAAAFTERVRTLGGGAGADVEGNEFTVVEDRGPVRLSSIVIDALDPERQLAFWAFATGYIAKGSRCDPPPGAKYVQPFSDGVARERDLIPGLRFVETSQPKTVKNRLHLDIQADAESSRERLVAAGATVLSKSEGYYVLADPEGNEFCVG